MKLPTLGVTLRPSFSISAVTQGSHFSLCAIGASMCALSSIAATPAAIAGAVTLNGPRTRFSTSATAAGQ